jgi:D-tyrosyl-tRNA(Tyr) deacylase
MIGVIQRVARASVSVDEHIVSEIGRGILALVAVEPSDTEVSAERLVDRVLSYRVFEDSNGRMNLSLRECDGALLLVPQFTLAADTRKGLRPSFTSAAPPELGQRLFDHAFRHAERARPGRVASGRFGAHMQVALVNDGPVTFWLRSTPGATESP